MSAATATISLRQQAADWAFAVRAYSFPASIAPVLLGSVYAWQLGHGFNWLNFVLAMIAGVLFQTGCNLVNDYFDYKYKVDLPGTMGGSGMLTSGNMTMRQFLWGAIISLGVGSLIGIYFMWWLSDTYAFGWPMLAIGGAGLLAAVFYTATPQSAKYNALGEPLVFVTMGIGYVIGAFLLQARTVTWDAVWLSIPLAFLVAAILQANDTRDIADDRDSKITRTVSTMLGATGARVFTSFLLFAPYVSLLALCIFGIAPWMSMIALASLPAAIKIHRVFWTHREEKHKALGTTVPDTAKLHMMFGVLMSLGVIAGKWLP